MSRLIVGLVTIGLAMWGVIVWWQSFGMVMRGLVPYCLLVFGLVSIASGLRRLRLRE